MEQRQQHLAALLNPLILNLLSLLVTQSCLKHQAVLLVSQRLLKQRHHQLTPPQHLPPHRWNPPRLINASQRQQAMPAQPRLRTVLQLLPPLTVVRQHLNVLEAESLLLASKLLIPKLMGH